MKTFLFILLWTMTSVSMAKINVTVQEVMDASFAKVDKIEAKSLILSAAQSKQIQSKAKAKIDTKVYRYYNVFSKAKHIGTGVLISRKMRTKKATVLYVFDASGTLRFTEIMAFGEPPEFIPNSTWMGQFKQRSTDAALTIGKDIPTISGATLSARSITQAARIARAIYAIVLKSK